MTDKKTMARSKEFNITGYYPGLVGEMTRAHAVYYHDHWGFDVTFETQVGRELSAFALNLDPARDWLWGARDGHVFAGSAAIDGSLSRTEGARLRWFIVEPPYQGSGLGKTLLMKAVDFCEKAGHPQAFLWTFAGLDPARRLYEGAGFVLDEEKAVEQWGGDIVEQKFVLKF